MCGVWGNFECELSTGGVEKWGAGRSYQAGEVSVDLCGVLMEVLSKTLNYLG